MDGSVLITAREAFADVREGLTLRRRAEAQVIRALCDLAACYRVNEDELIEPLAERLVSVGGEGTPSVSEHLRLEVQGLLGCSAPAAACQIADAINLRFRHPMLYEAVQELTIDSARALRAARRCAGLDPVAAESVTSAWLPRQAGLGWTAAMNLLDKLIIEADPVLADEKELRARAHRGIWAWGLEHGVMNLTGRLDVLDGRLLDVRLDQVAELLEDRYPHLNHQQRRAKAIALLAEPARAMALLASERQAELPFGADPPEVPGLVPVELLVQPEDEQAAPPPEDHFPEPAWAVGGSDPPGALGIVDPAVPPGDPTRPPGAGQRCCRCGEARCGPPADATAADGGPPTQARPAPAPPANVEGSVVSADLRGTTAPLDAAMLKRLRPSLGIAVHIHSDALGDLVGAARIERAGHITTALLADLLGEGDFSLKVQPVIDLPRMAPADAYVAGPRMRRAVELAFPSEPFPFSTRRSAGLDLDHTVAFRAGRRGQTRIGNLAPVTRGVHRAKTAGFWTLEQPEPGRLLWTSPLGHRYELSEWGTLTVPAGSRSLSRSAGAG